MKVTPQAIPEVLLIEPRRFGDARGFFSEVWKRSALREAGLDAEFVQDNHSLSRRDTLRGLHFQVARPQGKLVRVIEGAIWDVAVDIRRGSPTFGQWTAVVLSAENKRHFWIPEGFAHGFVALADDTRFLYKTTDFYARDCERAIRWNDPAIGIAWPEGIQPLLAAKDAAAPALRDAPVF